MMNNDSFCENATDWEEVVDNFNFRAFENANLDFQTLEYKSIAVEKSLNAYLNSNILFYLIKDRKIRVVKT